MSAYALHPSAMVTKLLMTGDSGSGKTGLLASLANAGYRLHIIDLDNGLDILASYLTPEGAKNVFYETLDSKSPHTPKRVLELLNHWKTKQEDHGPIENFDERDVIVLDSATFYGSACLAHAKDKMGEVKDERQLWKVAGPFFEGVIAYLTQSPKVKCNVIINTHLRLIESDQGVIQKMYPNAMGKAMSRSISSYFNNVWRVETKLGGKLIIKTKSDHLMALKSSAPNLLAAEEEADLVKLFDKVRQNALKIKETLK